MDKDSVKTKVNILYLYAHPAEQGFDHIDCRKLIDSLKEHYDVTLSWRILPDDTFSKTTLKQQSIAESDFLHELLFFLYLDSKQLTF